MTRDVARRLAFLLMRAGLASAGGIAVGSLVPACYTGGGGGTNPPTATFYFPVGLAVSSGGNALYAANSDWDLQWNGGTLQSYDLFLIRRHTAELILANETQQWLATGTQTPDSAITFLTSWQLDCQNPSVNQNPDGTRIALGEACAPPVDSTKYERNSAIIGAFATDLQLQTNSEAPPATPGGLLQQLVGTRLFAPVGGDATLTWADVGADDATEVPSVDSAAGISGPTWTHAASPFDLNCGQSANGGVCDPAHHAGNNPNDPLDTRELTMPGEPFGMAQTPDGTATAVTHQTESETSLLETGFQGNVATTSLSAGFQTNSALTTNPSMQFVVDNLANGGTGIAAIPHDPDAPVPPCELVNDVAPCVRPAFFETNTSTAELERLRYYDDDGTSFGDAGGISYASSLRRPFLELETTFPLTSNSGGSDTRGIVVDPTPRIACKAAAQSPADVAACAEKAARVFFASRSPASLVVGEVGSVDPVSGIYDPDDFIPSGNSIPLLAGPSKVYLAPIVNVQNQYELRVFVVNFDSSTISIIDPAHPDVALVDTIYTGPGPFAMAFDPFSLNQVATNALDRVATNDPKNPKGLDPRQDPRLNLKPYRFAYVASFNQSFVQVIDLDQSEPTYESVVFTLGKPTPPKGQ
jgi:hypothetical protein